MYRAEAAAVRVPDGIPIKDKAVSKGFSTQENSWFPTPLLMNPVDDFALGRIAADGVAEDLAYLVVVIFIQGLEQLRQALFEDIPRQVIFLSAHDHRMAGHRHVVADQQFLIELFPRSQTGELDGYIAMGIFFGADTKA